MKVWTLRAALAAGLLLAVTLPVSADGGEAAAAASALWPTILAWLVPIGLGLVACGAVPPAQVSSVIRLGWLALSVSVIGYWLFGFAFQFGALGFIPGQNPELAGLVRQWNWSPLNPTWGEGWGVIGLQGYALQGAASTPAALQLFFSQLPWITTAVALPLWSLQGRTRPVVLLLSAALTTLLYAVIGNWTWGGGWLANLGLNLNLGHGYVDYAGAGLVHLVGATSAFAGMLAFGVRPAARPQAEQLSLPALERGPARGIEWTAQDQAYVPMPPCTCQPWLCSEPGWR